MELLSFSWWGKANETKSKLLKRLEKQRALLIKHLLLKGLSYVMAKGVPENRLSVKVIQMFYLHWFNQVVYFAGRIRRQGIKDTNNGYLFSILKIGRLFLKGLQEKILFKIIKATCLT